MSDRGFGGGLLLAAVAVMIGCGDASARICARTDCMVPPSWTRPSIHGATYRPLLWNEGRWSVGGKAVENSRYGDDEGLSLFKDNAVTYTGRQQPVRRIKLGRKPGSPGLSTEDLVTYAHWVDDPPPPKEKLELFDFFGDKPVWKALLERHRPGQPFFLHCHQVRPAFFLERTYSTDREGFARWMAANPNFMGFSALGEFDSDAFYYCWKGRQQIPKMSDETLRRHFEEGFPFPRGQYEWTNLLAEAWSRSAQLLFGRGDMFWPTCSGYYSLNHIFARFGAAGLIYESTGQGCPRWQVAGAFTRGAARQYGLAFVWYQAHFMTLYRRGEYGRTVGGNNRWNQKPDAFGGPWKGLSRQLFNRQSLYGWLIGSSFNGVEDWPNLFSTPDDHGIRHPNDFARDFSALNDLHKRVDRGVSCTPIALLVPFTDRYSCWGHTDDIVDDLSQNSFWLTLVPPKADLSQLKLRRVGDEGCFFNSPYADCYDTLNADAGQDAAALRAALAPYACAFLVGTYRPGDLDVASLSHYVENGGTLVVSADQVADGLVPPSLTGVAFDGNGVPSGASLRSRDGREVLSLENPYVWLAGRPTSAVPMLQDERGTTAAFSNEVGRGRIVTICARKIRPTPELDKKDVAEGRKRYDLIAWLLDSVQRETMPVLVEGDVQWGVNRTADGLLVYLFNNRGVTHYSGEEPTVDPRARARAAIAFNHVKPASVTDAVTGKALPFGTTAEVDVEPGGWRLVSIKVQ